MDQFSVVLYVYSFVALGYCILAMSFEKIKYNKAKKH